MKKRFSLSVFHVYIILPLHPFDSSCNLSGLPVMICRILVILTGVGTARARLMRINP